MSLLRLVTLQNEYPFHTHVLNLVTRMVMDNSNTGVMGSNSARGMDVCLRFAVLCCPVYVKALRRDDPPSKEPYQIKRVHSFKG
jgi:hypothetical protein